MNKCILYARVSTQNQCGNDAFSLKSQVKELREYAQVKGLRVDQTVSELGSALKPIFERPVFKEIYEEINKGNQVTLLCKSIDRVARDSSAAFLLFHLVEKHDLKVVTPHGVYDANENSESSLVLELAIVAGYRREMSKRIKRGLARRVSV